MHALLVIFDRLPYGLLGCSGNTETRTPGFDRLAAGGITFDSCFASSASLDGAVPELAEAVTRSASHGVSVRIVEQSGCVSTGPIEAPVAVGDVRRMMIPEDDRPLADRVGSLLEPHSIPLPDESSVLTIVALRGVPADCSDKPVTDEQSAVFAADAVIDRILDQSVPVAGPRQLLLVTAAQGLQQPEDASDPAAAVRICDSLVHVPLLGRNGSSLAAGVRCNALVSIGDVGVTLQDWFGLRNADSDDDVSLLPMFDGDDSGARELLILQAAGKQVGIRTRDWLLVTLLDEERSASQQRVDAVEAAALFRKPEDLWDVLDVSTQSPDVVERLVDRLIGFFQPGKS